MRRTTRRSCPRAVQRCAVHPVRPRPGGQPIATQPIGYADLMDESAARQTLHILVVGTTTDPGDLPRLHRPVALWEPRPQWNRGRVPYDGTQRLDFNSPSPKPPAVHVRQFRFDCERDGRNVD